MVDQKAVEKIKGLKEPSRIRLPAWALAISIAFTAATLPSQAKAAEVPTAAAITRRAGSFANNRSMSGRLGILDNTSAAASADIAPAEPKQTEKPAADASTVNLSATEFHHRMAAGNISAKTLLGTDLTRDQRMAAEVQANQEAFLDSMKLDVEALGAYQFWTGFRPSTKGLSHFILTKDGAIGRAHSKTPQVGQTVGNTL